MTKCLNHKVNLEHYRDLAFGNIIHFNSAGEYINDRFINVDINHKNKVIFHPKVTIHYHNIYMIKNGCKPILH